MMKIIYICHMVYRVCVFCILLARTRTSVRVRAPERHVHPPVADPRVRARPGLQTTAVSPFILLPSVPFY